MISIYLVNVWDGNDGRTIVDSKFFLDENDADKFAAVDTRTRKKDPPVMVWETGEYSSENEAKQVALSKLTEKEKRILGLIQ